jgi:hypothetical protein
MRAFPANKKFMIIQGHKQKAQDTDVSTEDPLVYVSSLKAPSLSVEELMKLRVKLTSQPMSWIRSFLSKSGLIACCELLSSRSRKLK